jgi:hypothetical protein
LKSVNRAGAINVNYGCAVTRKRAGNQSALQTSQSPRRARGSFSAFNEIQIHLNYPAGSARLLFSLSPAHFCALDNKLSFISVTVERARGKSWEICLLRVDDEFKCSWSDELSCFVAI